MQSAELNEIEFFEDMGKKIPNVNACQKAFILTLVAICVFRLTIDYRTVICALKQ